VSALAAEARTVVHSCAASPPMEVLTAVGSHALSLDLSVVDIERAADSLAEFVDRGGDIWAGLPLTGPATDGPIDGVAGPPLRLLRRLRSALAIGHEQFAQRAVITPACGLAGQTIDVTRAAYAAAERLATRVEQGDVGGGSGQEESEAEEGALRDGS